MVYHGDDERVKTGKTLGVFAKRPRAGEVKTRLAASTSPEWAAQVAVAFLGDTLARLGSLAERRILVHAPDDAAADLAVFAGDRFTLLPQGGGDLGARLARFIADHHPCVVVGSDSPTVPVAFVERALAALDLADVVLGPATDGGYYLIGCREPMPILFESIEWSGPRVLSETMECLPASCRLELLPPWYDIDSQDDWTMLVGHLAAMRRAGVDPVAPQTESLCNAGFSRSMQRR